MIGYTGFLKIAVKNKVLHYVISRYATYFIQFINSIFIAVYLGPYYLGIWGFISLIIQYLNQFNLGIAHSVNAIISIHKNKEWYIQKVIGTSLSMLTGLSLFVALFFIANELFHLNIGEKYNFSTYAPIVAVIGILGYFNSLLSNIFRVYGKLIEIAINQSAFPLLMLITIVFFKGQNLLWALVISNLLAFVLSFGLYVSNTPVKLKTIFIGRLIKIIQIRGWHLFVYNTSFYLIIISTKTLISAYYSIEEFGYFTFAFALANAIFLLFESFSFLIFPKLLNRFASNSNQQISLLLNNIREVYITFSHAFIHLAIVLFPVFIQFFPKYEQTSNVFKMIALTIVLYTNSFGYQGLLIAKGKEKLLGKLSLIGLIVNVGVSIFLILILNTTYSYVIISTIVTYSIYVFLIGYYGNKLLIQKTDFLFILKSLYPIRLMIPYLVSLILIFFNIRNIIFIIPLTLFLLFNYKVLYRIKDFTKTVITNPNFIYF